MAANYLTHAHLLRESYQIILTDLARAIFEKQKNLSLISHKF